MYVSSAYKFEAVSFNDVGKSLIDTKSRSGSGIEPCRTPHVSKPSYEKTPSINTKIFYVWKIGFEPFNYCFLKNYTFHFFSKRSWSNVSNVFCRSIKIISVCFPLFMPLIISSVSWTRQELVERVLLNPDWNL